MKTYVIGNENCVLGLSMVGISGQVVRTAEETRDAVRACMADKTIALLLVTSDVADLARDLVDKTRVESLTPLLVEIPGEGQEGASVSLKDFVQGAIGINLGGTAS